MKTAEEISNKLYRISKECYHETYLLQAQRILVDWKDDAKAEGVYEGMMKAATILRKEYGQLPAAFVVETEANKLKPTI